MVYVCRKSETAKSQIIIFTSVFIAVKTCVNMRHDSWHTISNLPSWIAMFRQQNRNFLIHKTGITFNKQGSPVTWFWICQWFIIRFSMVIFFNWSIISRYVLLMMWLAHFNLFRRDMVLSNCAIWLWNMVSYIQGRTEAMGIWKQDPDVNIWDQEGCEWGVVKASQRGTS